MDPDISVIILARNEAANLPKTLASLEAVSPSLEVIVVDGGSEDKTAEVARASGANVIRSEKAHRAHQLNLGARAASAPLILFLHADTLLPPRGLEILAKSLHENPGLVGGGFARRFDSPSLFLRATAALADFRARHFGLFLGDQAIFVRRAAFDELGGYDETLDLCEDLDFSRRLRASGPTAILRPPVLELARRFDARGPLRTTLDDLGLALRYFRSRKHPDTRIFKDPNS